MIIRNGEAWINGWGLFWWHLYGVETPGGHTFMFAGPFWVRKLRRLQRSFVPEVRND